MRNGKIKFENYSNINFQCGRFEELAETEAKYNAIFAAQAFHWITQPLGYEKCAKLLKNGGYLAPFWNMYLYDESEESRELIELSRKYGGIADFVNIRQAEERIENISSEIENSGLFYRPIVYKHFWKMEYTADEYYGFALTGNHFLQLPKEIKENAHKDLIKHANKFGGKIVRPYLCVLYLAKLREEL